MSGRIADELARIAEELVVLIVQETIEPGFSKHLTVPSGRHHECDGTPDLARRFASGQAMGTIGPVGPESI